MPSYILPISNSLEPQAPMGKFHASELKLAQRNSVKKFKYPNITITILTKCSSVNQESRD